MSPRSLDDDFVFSIYSSMPSKTKSLSSSLVLMFALALISSVMTWPTLGISFSTISAVIKPPPTRPCSIASITLSFIFLLKFFPILVNCLWTCLLNKFSLIPSVFLKNPLFKSTAPKFNNWLSFFICFHVFTWFFRRS